MQTAAVVLNIVPVTCSSFRFVRMTELSKMEDAEEQAFLEDVNTLQTIQEHARNLDILREQKEKRTKCVWHDVT